MTYLACNHCKWVHFSRTLEQVTTEVDKFNAYYDTLDDKTKSYFGRKSSVKNYIRCHRCGESYKQFRVAEDSEVPNGSTINPILHFSEVLE